MKNTKVKTINSQTLKEVLHTLTKDQLTEIRRYLDVKGASKAKKEELITILEKEIIVGSSFIFSNLDESQYIVIRKIVENGGITDSYNWDEYQIKVLQNRGLIFPGMVDGKSVLQVPQELVYVFMEADGKELQKRVQKNSEYYQLVRGLLYYYGVINYYQLYDLVSRYRKIEDLDLPYFFRALEQGAEFYGGIDIFSSGYACEWAEKPEEVKQEHKMREDLDYYPFTYGQVMKAGEEDYIDKTPEFYKLSRFLVDSFGVDPEEAEETVDILWYQIQNDEPLENAFGVLQEIVEFPGEKDLKKFMDLLTQFHNGTRLWVLKGHRPNDVFKSKEKSNLIPFPGSRPVATENKVGRNDPCPCGSGKKYKKCCINKEN